MRPAKSRPRGFTLIELMIVVAIIGVLAALSIDALSNAKEISAVSQSADLAKSTLRSLRNYALSNAASVVVVVISNQPSLAMQCGMGSLPPEQDPNCVRFFVLLDINNASSLRFDSTALMAFDPTTVDPVSKLTPDGDRLLEVVALDRGIHIGSMTAPTISVATPAVVGAGGGAASAMDSLNLSNNCSFCVASSPVTRGYISFTARGEAKLDDAFSTDPGAVLILEHARRGTRRLLAMLQPSGLVTERIGRDVVNK